MLFIYALSTFPFSIWIRVWWVELGWPPGAHQGALSLPLFNRTEGKKNVEKLMDQDKDRDITYQLPSWAKQLNSENINLLPINSRWG